MIQRIQSVYLLLATICYVVAFFIDFASVEGLSTALSFGLLSGTEIGEYAFTGNLFLNYGMFVNGLLCGLSATTIFLFKNRKSQFKMAYLAFGIALLYLILIFMGLDKVKLAFAGETDVKLVYKAGTYLPVAAIAFLILAHRSIKKDEELVKSIDRLR